ncbi:MAG TPA: family 43 glycosylhydrolase [Propionibacteriaceae bacterium]|nr:family 43 glycosylhydrolase [Propionibacteriaceae bacterium]
MTWTLPERWNPILPGFHPDPSIVEVGGTYVLATSTFEWWPGVQLHTSTDLVHWVPAGAVFTDPEGLDLSDVPELGGLWAPSISYVGNRYWLVNACVRTPGPRKDIDVLLTTAADLSGPWTRPVRLGGGGFDPSIFHENGRHWLLNMRWDPRPDRFSFAGITIQEIDETGPIDDERLVLVSEHLQEGPNLYAVDGWYYLMMAEGGTDWNHGIRMARSRELYGPYEVDPEPLLTTRDDPAAMLAKAGHGELLRTPDGGWAIVHLASRPIDRADGRFCVLGRETCLEPVVWADGWPRLAHGGHLPRGYRPHDEAGAYPVTFEDPFDEPSLDQRWVTLRNPPDSSWLDLSSRPGWLRLRGRRGLGAQTHVSLVATRLLSTYCTVTTEVVVEPTTFVQAAGLALWYDRKGHHTVLVRGSEDGPQIVVATSDLDAYSELETGLLVAGWPSVHLRAEIRGLGLRFAVSEDGVAWQQVGDELDLAVTSDDHGVMRFTGTMIALLAIDTGPADMWAAFSGITVGE